MKELIEFLQREWTPISTTPLTFIVALILVFGLAYAASRWRHCRIIELLRERLAAKDQLLEEYRERLHLVPASGSELIRLSHSELQAQALKFVDTLRKWLAAKKQQDSERQNQKWVAMTHAASEEQRKQLWDSHTADLTRSSIRLNNEYDTKFMIRAIVLRDEMLARLKHPNPKSHALHIYEHATNPIGMRMVADDLELLARNLG